MEKLLDKKQAADYLGISVRSVDYFRLTGGLPFHVLNGKLVRFVPRELEAWVLGNKAGSGNDNDKQTEEENAKN